MFSTKTTRELAAIQWALGWHSGGVQKRIDEGRELLELLQEGAPEFLAAHGWVELWIKSTDEFLTHLSEATSIPSSRFPPKTHDSSGSFPRPWPAAIEGGHQP